MSSKCTARVLIQNSLQSTDIASRIESNVANSLLLSLPLEIRETILNYILGNKCIHVKLKTVAERYENFVTWNVDIKNIVVSHPTSRNDTF